MKAIRILAYLLLLLAIFAVAFFFYGSGSGYSEESYDQVTKYQAENIIPQDTLSVATYNIGYMSGMTNNLPYTPDRKLYEGNMQNCLNLFSVHKPDIIGFQEIDFNSDRSFNVNQLDEIAQNLNYSNGHYSVNWDKRYVPFPYFPLSAHFGSILSGQAVLSKYPISSLGRIVLDRPENNVFYYDAFYIDRLIQVSEIKINERTVYVLNVHLEAYDQETREKQAVRVIEVFDQYASNNPTLLIGDFNAMPYKDSGQDKTFETIMNSKNIDHAFDKARYEQGAIEEYTYSSASPKAKIDYIFYTPKYIEPLEYKVLTEAGEVSDHLPVMFTFLLN